jgi:hypothetical protein
LETGALPVELRSYLPDGKCTFKPSVLNGSDTRAVETRGGNLAVVDQEFAVRARKLEDLSLLPLVEGRRTVGIAQSFRLLAKEGQGG